MMSYPTLSIHAVLGHLRMMMNWLCSTGGTLLALALSLVCCVRLCRFENHIPTRACLFRNRQKLHAKVSTYLWAGPCHRFTKSPNIDNFGGQYVVLGSILIGSQDEMSPYLNLQKIGYYVSSTTNPSYDHSFFIMKARYNCAYPSSDIGNGSIIQATDQKLVLKSSLFSLLPSSSSVYCDIQAYVTEAGTFSQIAERSPYNKWNHQNKIQNNVRTTNKKKPLQVLLQGTRKFLSTTNFWSIGLQIWIQHNRFQSTKKWCQNFSWCFDARGNKSFTNQDLGDIIGFEEARTGCHAPKVENTKTPPYSSMTCPVIIERVYRYLQMEFPDAMMGLRTWNLIIPYECITYSLMIVTPLKSHNIFYKHLFGIDNVQEEIDVLVWNRGGRIMQGTSQNVPNIQFSDTPENLRTIQKRDTGQCFGANNPWIYHVPDGHPCMPGIPDDEVNLLLMIVTWRRGSDFYSSGIYLPQSVLNYLPIVFEARYQSALCNPTSNLIKYPSTVTAALYCNTSCLYWKPVASLL